MVMAAGVVTHSKENMIEILSRWNQKPRAYWNLMSCFFWYKNAALMERDHPIIASFFRLKDRLARRPGFAVDPLPVHLWKRAKEVANHLISWAESLEEMEEVWLHTRKKSEKEEKWLEELHSSSPTALHRRVNRFCHGYSQVEQRV